jgi:hypothetical protein
MNDRAFYDEAFRYHPTAPADIREAAERICNTYEIRGICDPMYIANVIAMSTGRGDGKSNFWEIHWDTIRQVDKAKFKPKIHWNESFKNAGEVKQCE